ncbi:ethanolamine ammonia-lyase reactivating factor EutA [Propionibacterium australiense]|uniref:Ethanolamine utilisation protein EutA n=1 Tax=Propionibacterium australiense TaxID=119981 RepID=A0A383S8Z8_9ACTN|nr:ethanolamine ammonia-lyase reactivating factor EutA [Propionibacterium australiense]RLP10938.1 ethanolamine utilization protein EutA [Propionibacterium australiense]RLP13095.1 ethanolamine utilization protein EutA [Propionibacterium australiense]SYZ33894.1 Ethanolamine utilisation protein EutA [Propionibacterium australiense]VEH90898.1 reactivating factor for ethanolamine ammonia lyase [Propionibacterium australiense]
MQQLDDVVSIGIDVGTTTTQVVLSRLTVTQRGRTGAIPRLDVGSSEILYQSEPAITPLISPEEIDVDALLGLVRNEISRSGIPLDRIETGAVIITGESARKHNSEAILSGLADVAGDFVVTVAGPNLESQIAGRGSGACDWSASHYCAVVNVDIGGGSANAAVFSAGNHVSSSAAMVGGRQVMLDPETGTLVHVAPSGRIIADALHLDDLVEGRRPSIRSLRRLTDAMADVIVDLITGVTTPMGNNLALSPPMELPDHIAAYFLSGGVGRLYYEKCPAESLADIARYGDVGPLLAKSLRENQRLQRLVVREPAQTLRATVLGAASQHVTLSGSTIWADRAILPLRSLPVIEPHLVDSVSSLADAGQVENVLTAAVQRWSGQDPDIPWAVNLDLPAGLDYAEMVAVAQGCADFATKLIRTGLPLVLVTEHDFAQVIGQTINIRAPDLPVIVVDQVDLGEGDFIDIGEPMFDGRVVPVSVKTLVFYTEQGEKP